MPTPIAEQGQRAKGASRRLATASTGAKDAALHAAADLLVQRAPEILRANAKDVERAEQSGTTATVARSMFTNGSRRVTVLRFGTMSTGGAIMSCSRNR